MIHPSSVAVSREHRRAKTDRLDTELLKRGVPGVAAGIGAIAAWRACQRLTILSCGLVEATALASQLDPEDLRAVIVDYHRCRTEVIGGFGGLVAIAPGDRVTAYFGYPEAHEHDAEQAVRAGLALIEAAVKQDIGVATWLRETADTGDTQLALPARATNCHSRQSVNPVPTLQPRSTCRLTFRRSRPGDCTDRADAHGQAALRH